MYVFTVEMLNGDSRSAVVTVVASTSKVASDIAVKEHNKSQYIIENKMNEHCVINVERGALVWGIESRE